MANTLYSLILATAGMAAGDTLEPPPLATWGYGGYGSLGAYGGYSYHPGAANRNPYARGCIMPFYICPSADCGHGPGGEARKEHELLEKRFGELKTILGIYEQKIRGLESKIEDHDKTNDSQVRIMETLDKRVAETMAKYQAMTLEALDKRLEEKLHKDVETAIAENIKTMGTRLDDRLRNLEDKVLAAGKAMPTGLDSAAARGIEERLAMIESALKGQVNNQVASQAQPRNPLNDKTGLAFNRGLIVVSLPADARLFLDGHPSAVGANLRSFISPELELNKNYFYTIRAEIDRNGRTLTESQRVYFQPGREVRVSFDHLEQTATNMPRTIQKSN